MVLLLPHGYDGAGPDHSSAKVERFLQLVDTPGWHPSPSPVPLQTSVNFQVLNCTTPANYFHALRRQILRPFRKPLVIMAPKTLLRSAHATSSWSDFQPSSHFQPLLVPTCTSASAIKRLLFCTGKLYYELDQLETLSKDDTLVIRIEQLAPFPFSEMESLLKEQFPNVQQLAWVQEEPINQGAWNYIQAHFQHCTSLPLQYHGPSALPASAMGLAPAHQLQKTTYLSLL